jgi:hypothetical protein
MMKTIAIVFVVVLVCGCQAPRSTSYDAPLDTLTGVVVRKDWAKSMESWNAGGSEYFVLKVEGGDLPSDKRTATEGVILRPSKAIPFEHFTNFVGQAVTCQGEFIAGKPYIPPSNSVEQMPSPVRNPFGFKVYVIEPVQKK